MIIAKTYPTHEYQGFKLRAGKPLPFGATVIPGGVNFSVFSRYATGCILVLYKKKEKEPFLEVPFFEEFRIGNVFSMIVYDLEYDDIEYGFKMMGIFDSVEGQRFDKEKVLADPYAKSMGGREVWGEEEEISAYRHRSRIQLDDFNWEIDRPLEIPVEKLIIYEMHVRGFTAHPSSKTNFRGTFTALREKIPYLKELGINCVELMPIFEFDEFENRRTAPTGEKLLNYWGYSTAGFFAPKTGYAATGKNGTEVDELKSMIKDLHSNGIEVMLDVVLNHTAEGDQRGPYISFRGIDNKTYYMLTPEGYYYNFSGCGNTLNCNNPIVRNFILDCLRYWASEYHIDGFRFDLASILGRDQNGAPMANPPLLETLAFDPILGKCKLVAEAWDAGGLYQVGSFPSSGRWAEWNGKYRDDVRKFLKGDGGKIGAMTQRLTGSPDLYGDHAMGAKASINFITCHDGFTLMDLVSYNEKHNEANGEDNKDGANDNESWNCGIEGETKDKEVLELRRRQVKNAVTLLMVSQGVPMILAGDEMGNSQKGNNNAYCQDNALSWLNWDLVEKNNDIFEYFRKIISFRKKYPVLNGAVKNFYSINNYPEVSFHGTKAWNVNYDGHELAIMYCDVSRGREEFIYIAMNMHWEGRVFDLPILPIRKYWYVIANTGMETGQDIWDDGEEKRLEEQSYILSGPRSIIVLVGR